MTTVNDSEPRPRPADPDRAEELKRRYDIDAETVSRVDRELSRREEAEARELFGDNEPVPIPDPDTDA
jgi:hypothetical protein